MYHRIRITVASLVVMVICLLSSTGTLSYFTDSDSKTNDFVIGNASTALKVYDDISSETRRELSVENYVNSPLVQDMLIPYYPQATNNGNIPVYQRFRIVIPIALSNVLTLELPCTLETSPENVKQCVTADEKYTVSYSEPILEGESEPKNVVYYIVSNEVLAVGNVTHEWPVTAIQVGDISSVENLEQATTCENNDVNKCSFGVKIYSDVIQTTGFGDAVSAFLGFAETN